MLQSSNQVPSTPVPTASVSATISGNSIPQMPINENNVWAQPKPSIPPMIQPHGKQLFVVGVYSKN